MGAGIGVLIVGAGGQLGRELQRTPWPSGFEVTAKTSAELDITNNALVTTTVEQLRPSIIVNAAAYTAVDAAEDNTGRAMAVNAEAVGHLAAAADRVSAGLVHLSTDYVFDGKKKGWYTELDDPNPLGVYGRTKMLGERAAFEAERSVTLRTSWVYSALGSNFVTKVLELASNTDDIGIVGDQQGCPTSTGDLAQTIVRLVEIAVSEREWSFEPLYHVASPDSATWYEFSQAILGMSVTQFSGRCREITTADYPTRAKRPANSRLDGSLIESDFKIGLPSWRDSLRQVIAEIEG